ncbi:hypothetical protein PVAG01_10218 [Phlyctema vagabunda]|uniref:Uncharacterized protein n=1 Tax=Phlyctema vagabunda TaxID=108571 RepID=A0ABR4P5B2_9HELO
MPSQSARFDKFEAHEATQYANYAEQFQSRQPFPRRDHRFAGRPDQDEIRRGWEREDVDRGRYDDRFAASERPQPNRANGRYDDQYTRSERHEPSGARRRYDDQYAGTERPQLNRASGRYDDQYTRPERHESYGARRRQDDRSAVSERPAPNRARSRSVGLFAGQSKRTQSSRGEPIAPTGPRRNTRNSKASVGAVNTSRPKCRNKGRRVEVAPAAAAPSSYRSYAPVLPLIWCPWTGTMREVGTSNHYGTPGYIAYKESQANYEEMDWEPTETVEIVESEFIQ